MNGNRRWSFWCGLLLLSVCLWLLLASADRRVLLLALNTLWVSLGACCLSVPAGTWLAVVLSRTDVPGRRFFALCVASLIFLPLYMHAAAWDAGFGKLGWYSSAIANAATPLLGGWLAVVWIHALWSLAWVTLIVATALRLSEPEFEEIALLDATPGQVFWSVTMRRALPGIGVAALWVVLTTAAEMTVTDLYQVRTLAEELYTGFALADDAAPARALTSAAIVAGVLVGGVMMIVPRVGAAAEHVSMRAMHVFPLGVWRGPMAMLVLLLLLLLVGVPLGNLTYQAGLVVKQVDGDIVRSWSFARCSELLVPQPTTYRVSAIWEFRHAFGWTVLIGACAATAALLTGAPLAWWARRGGRQALPAVFVVSAGLATAGPLVGLAVIHVFTLSDHPVMIWLYDRTIAAPVLALTCRCLPLTIMICWMAFGGLSRVMVEAAMLDGAGRLARFLHIGLAQRVPALAVAWLVAMAGACGELSASILVVPPGVTTVPIRVFGLLHAGVKNQVAAICLTSIAGFLLITVLIGFFGHRALGRIGWRP